MTDFIREGHFARHIRRMRMLYAQRRAALVQAIEKHMGGKLEVVGAEAGMHLVALLPPRRERCGRCEEGRATGNFRAAFILVLFQAARRAAA